MDPDEFSNRPDFFVELERIGYRCLLLGGTGGARMSEAVHNIRSHTDLQIYMHPSSPGEIMPVDLIFFPAVMNSNSHYTRPFGSGSVACAMAIAELGVPFLPVAYFILGESTAKWYADAFMVRSNKLIVGYCLYAKMMQYEHVFLDYEGPKVDIDASLIHAIKVHTNVHLLVSDEFTPETAHRAVELGIETIVTPSNIYERAKDPSALAKQFYDRLLAPAQP
ncbi:MAG: hypothetical protein JOZ39_01610 [Chloroflexi bacterium]|nr:hypothetical protein [Chloroflexota bacterium]